MLNDFGRKIRDFWKEKYEREPRKFQLTYMNQLRKNKFDYEEKKEIKKCNHQFVITREESPRSVEDYIRPWTRTCECIHCGLTNKYDDIEIMAYASENEKRIAKFLSEEYKKEYHDELLISNKVVRSAHPRFLYKISKSIKPVANEEELIDIMIELNELEKPEELLEKKEITKETILERYIIKQLNKIKEPEEKSNKQKTLK